MKNLEKKIATLKQYFTITVAAFEIQHTIKMAFGFKCRKSYIHLLHIKAKEEIEKENPDLNVVYKYLKIIENETKNYQY